MRRHLNTKKDFIVFEAAGETLFGPHQKLQTFEMIAVRWCDKGSAGFHNVDI